MSVASPTTELPRLTIASARYVRQDLTYKTAAWTAAIIGQREKVSAFSLFLFQRGNPDAIWYFEGVVLPMNKPNSTKSSPKL